MKTSTSVVARPSGVRSCRPGREVRRPQLRPEVELLGILDLSTNAHKSMKRSLDSDAPRTTSTGSSSTPSFPALGEDASIWLPEHSLTLRYGTSLRLMASCSAFLNDSEEFAEVNPEDDWQKWANRVPGAFSLFYAAILDPLKPEGGGGVLCVLRAVLDNWPTPTAPHNARLIIGTTARPKLPPAGRASRLASCAT